LVEHANDRDNVQNENDQADECVHGMEIFLGVVDRCSMRLNEPHPGKTAVCGFSVKEDVARGDLLLPNEGNQGRETVVRAS